MSESFSAPNMVEGFRALLAAIDGRAVAVVGHTRPDGDCIGSQVALGFISRLTVKTLPMSMG